MTRHSEWHGGRDVKLDVINQFFDRDRCDELFRAGRWADRMTSTKAQGILNHANLRWELPGCG